jgi:hypothetical protein
VRLDFAGLNRIGLWRDEVIGIALEYPTVSINPVLAHCDIQTTILAAIWPLLILDVHASRPNPRLESSRQPW